MDDIRRQDLTLFVKELFTPWRVALVLVFGLMIYAAVRGMGFISANPVSFRTLLLVFSLFAADAITAYNTSVRKRFYGKRHGDMWEACRDRLVRFEEVLKRMRKDKVADLSEMPKTIRAVAQSLYIALRRADIIFTEVNKTEKEFYSQPSAWTAGSHDPQSQELYKQADRNIAEYRQQYAGVMAGVQRTEAQSAVFMTTVDTLRMKMLGYRLVGRSPELGSHEFLEALNEAKLQLQAIDKALDELDLGHYPKMIASMPPPPSMTTAVVEDQHLNQGN